VQLVVIDANAAIAFYRDAFAARELARTRHESGRVQHAEVVIGDSLLLLHDDFSDLGGPSAATPGCSGVTIHLYLPDADATFDRAITAGARSILPIDDQPWGDHYGIVEDPFGHRWSIGRRVAAGGEEATGK
jgi:PhnB protein